MDKKSTLVSRLTELEKNMHELHLGIEGLNRYNKERRKQRMVKQGVDFIKFITPYVVAGLLVVFIMHV